MNMSKAYLEFSMENKNWKREKLRATQPFFVLSSDEFIQESYRQMGISHFYMIRKRKIHRFGRSRMAVLISFLITVMTA